MCRGPSLRPLDAAIDVCPIQNKGVLSGVLQDDKYMLYSSLVCTLGVMAKDTK